MATSASIILLSSGILFLNWGEFTQDLSLLYRLSSLPLLVAVMFVVISVHEFAHGLTCKHFGGEVREIGFLLIYFQPALYCNVSDAWLFPEKRKRLWVSFAGPYFELFLWALATLTWRLTNPDTWVNSAALIVTAGSGVKTLLNFNPFVKFDGYYLLSDYLEIPNLRRKAFRYVGSLMKRPFGLEAPVVEEVSGRKRAIYLLYGLPGSIGTFALVGYILVTAGDYFIKSGQPLYWLFSLALVGRKLRRRVRRLFGKARDAFDDDDEDLQTSEPKEDLPTTGSNGSSESSTPAPSEPKKKRRSRFWRRCVKYTKWTALGGATLAVLFFVRMELRITSPFTILPAHNADVRAEIEGLIEEIYVTEGDAIREGELLARLSDREHRTELQKTEAQISQARARLRMQEAGPTEEEIEVARAAVEGAKDRLAFARARLDRDKNQVERSLISRKEFENTQELAVVAENGLSDAENKLQVLLRGTRKEEIDATKAEIAQLEAQKRYLEEQLQRVEVRSPADGIVATPARQLKEMVRQVIQKGALIARVYDLKKLTVEIAIPEKEIADVRVGHAVAFKVQAYPDRTFSGKVTSIATTALGGSSSSSGSQPSLPTIASSGSSPRTILITTEIDNSSLLLKPGMTGQAKVYCGERRIVDLMTRRLARTVKVEFWSWW